MSTLLHRHTIHDFAAFCKSETEKNVGAERIDKSADAPYNNNEERTTHTVSSSGYQLNMWQGHKVNRHFAGVAVVFLAGLAFGEVSFTRIVIVHFFIWKVIRISTTSLSEDGANRLRANVQLFTVPFREL